MGFEYISIGELDTQLFYTVPKELVRGGRYRCISSAAKLLYVIMGDRRKLSQMNGWADESGHVFIYYTLDEICRDMNVSRKTAEKLLDELEDRAFLIRRVRQGFGRPNRIYVGQVQTSGEGSPDGTKKCKKDTSGSAEVTLQEVSFLHANKNDKSHNEKNKNDLIVSIGKKNRPGMIDADPGQRDLREYFEERCAFEALKEEEPGNADRITEIEDLVIETCSLRTPKIRIGREEKCTDMVRSRLMKLDISHIRYVLACMEENSTDIRNIRQYLLTALFNAPLTISNYYRSKVSHDLYGSYEGRLPPWAEDQQ